MLKSNRKGVNEDIQLQIILIPTFQIKNWYMALYG